MMMVMTFGASAMAVQPKQQGMRPTLMVFNLPIDSMRKPASMQPIGTEITMTDAIHEDSVTVAWMSVSLLSSFGMRMAEKAREIPMTM